VHGTLLCPIAAPDSSPPLDPGSVRWNKRTVYAGILLNQPSGLQSVRRGEPVLFVHVPGIPYPLMVTPAYLSEREQWAFLPCSGCGAD
jgi:hypothetical protein